MRYFECQRVLRKIRQGIRKTRCQSERDQITERRVGGVAVFAVLVELHLKRRDILFCRYINISRRVAENGERNRVLSCPRPVLAYQIVPRQDIHEDAALGGIIGADVRLCDYPPYCHVGEFSRAVGVERTERLIRVISESPEKLRIHIPRDIFPVDKIEKPISGVPRALRSSGYPDRDGLKVVRCFV